MRVLIITKIFPNRHAPTEASYNRHQFRELARLCDVELLALLPWYPGRSTINRMRGRARPPVPRHDVIDGLDVEYARVLYLPKIGSVLSGPSYALSLLSRVLPRRGRIDVVLGSFAYPDGWAAVALAEMLRRPAVIKLHGSDVNIVSSKPMLLSGLHFSLSRAARVVGNSRKLLDKAVRFGADEAHVRLVHNGLDKALFRPRPREQARRELGLPLAGERVLFVGRAVRNKGIWELLEAIEALAAERPDLHLDIVGDGAEHAQVAARVRERGLPVSMYGALPPDQVAQYVAAANLVTLPSYNEGTPNTLIEALASGRPVVASDVGGIPALLRQPCQGELVAAQDASALAAALARVLTANYPADDVASASSFPDWGQSAAALYQVLREAHEQRSS